MAVRIAELWRYPVKTMAGEKLRRATVGPLGVMGDEVRLVCGRACAADVERRSDANDGNRDTPVPEEPA